MELAACDHAITPTSWQRDQFPPAMRSQLKVIHEGIDWTLMSSLRGAGLPLPACLPADPDLEVLTYVSRGFEEYRGFPQAMQAIALLQRQRPKLHVLIVGHDCVAYGDRRSDGRSWGNGQGGGAVGSSPHPLAGDTSGCWVPAGTCLQHSSSVSHGSLRIELEPA